MILFAKPAAPRFAGTFFAVMFLTAAAIGWTELSAAMASSASDWPQFGYDAGHTGFNPRETVLAPGNVNKLRVAWTFRVTPSFASIGSMVEADGLLFVPTAGGPLFALDVNTGAQKWSNSNALWGAAVDSKVVLFSCSNASHQEGLCAFQASNGKQIWTTLYSQGEDAETPPAVAGGYVYVTLCNSATCNLSQFDERSGAAGWSVSTGDSALCGGAAQYPPTVDDGVIATVSGCSGDSTTVSAFDASSGVLLWNGVFEGLVDGITAASGRVAISAGSCVCLLSARTGSQLWSLDAYGESTPAIAASSIYAVIESYLGAYRLRDATGRHGFEWALGGPLSGPAVANGVVYALDGEDTVGLSALDGSILWDERSASYYSSGPPIIANGMVISACSPEVCAWSLPSSERRPLSAAASDPPSGAHVSRLLR